MTEYACIICEVKLGQGVKVLKFITLKSRQMNQQAPHAPHEQNVGMTR
jgi:hypothetical protein